MSSSLTEKYKKVIVDNLEQNGVLVEMKSKLKSIMIDIVKKEKKSDKRKLDFELLTAFQRISKSKELMLLSHLIIEFMQFYEMEYTLPIFKGETNINEQLKKETLIKDSNLKTEYDEDKPILLQILTSYLKEPKKTLFDDAFNKKDREVNYSSYSGGLGLLGNYGNTGGMKSDPLSSINLSNSNANADKDNASSSLNSIKSKKLAPLSFGHDSQTSEEQEKTEEKLSPFAMLLQKKKEEEAKNSSENKFNNTNVYNNNESNKSPGNNITNNTNLNSNNNHNKFSPDINFNSYDYNTNNNKENILNDDDIKEEILVDNINNEKEEGEKDKSSSLHNYTSSQTFGYDNSVTSYNLDFYDYTEDVEIER